MRILCDVREIEIQKCLRDWVGVFLISPYSFNISEICSLSRGVLGIEAEPHKYCVSFFVRVYFSLRFCYGIELIPTNKWSYTAMMDHLL